ncbi:MAG: hypothetical protein ACTSW1_02810 [Candidatus Hodarchaeales archaeon]
MSQQRKLILTITNPEALQSACLDKNNANEFLIEVISGKISSIKVISSSVLVIKFETGVLRLDIDKNDLDKIQEVD